MTTFAPSAKFGKYRVLSQLGQGGMADVYEAEDLERGGVVALKVLPAAFARDMERVSRFRKEIHAAAALDHPGIVQVYELGEADGQHYFSMELFPGGDLRERLRHGPLSQRQACRVLRQVAAALDYAHREGFVHRDVKPENILFREDGTAVLSDFGIAHSVLSQSRVTGDGLTIGTPHYMSPEQARGQDLDGRSDLYALGIVFHEMLTGQVPFDAQDSYAIGLMHINDPAPRLPRRLAPYQPLIDRLLAKNPEKRYPVGMALIQDLRRAQRNSRSGTIRSYKSKKSPALVALSWAFGGAVLAGGLVLGVHQWQGRPEPVAIGGGATAARPAPPSISDPAGPQVETPWHAGLVQHRPLPLDRIDADTVYVLANLEPAPSRVNDLLWALIEFALSVSDELYYELLSAADTALSFAVIREILAIDSRKAMEDRGIHGQGLWILHGISLFPVLHWELIDADAFDAMLDRIAHEAGTQLPWRSIGDEEILWIEMEDFGLAIHNDRHFLTLAMVPDDISLLRRIVGLDRATRPLDIADLHHFNRQQGFSGHISGYFDFRRLLNVLIDRDEHTRKFFGPDDPLLTIGPDSQCARELETLIAQIPRLTMGTTRMHPRRVTTVTRMETHHALGSRLAELTNVPVALHVDRNSLMTAGASIDLGATRSFARELVASWIENPPACAIFLPIRERSREWQHALHQPIPPFITNIQGVRFNFDRVIFDDSGEPVDLTGTMAVFMHNPQMVVGLAQLFIPDLAVLDLQPDAIPRPIPSTTIPELRGMSAWAAMSNHAVGFALGEEQRRRLSGELRADQPDSAVLSYGVNTQGYIELVSQLLKHEFSSYDAEHDELIATLGRLGEIQQHQHASLHFRPKGIEIILDTILVH